MKNRPAFWLDLLNVFLTAFYLGHDFLYHNSYGIWHLESALLIGLVAIGILTLYGGFKIARLQWLFYAASVLLIADASPAILRLNSFGKNLAGTKLGGYL